MLTKQQKIKQEINRRYERSKKGHLERLYMHIKWRIKQKDKPYLKKGKIPTREEFIKFGMRSKKYNELYEKWKKSGYKLRLSPSIDRKDANKGYTLDNIQFVTFSENVIKGNKEKPHGRNKKPIIAQRNKIKKRFESGKEAAKFFNVSRVTLGAYLKTGKPLKGWKLSYEKEKGEK